MMMESIVLTVLMLIWLAIEFAKSDEAAQELIDYAAANGIDLDPARARRAVAAGRGEEFRRRLHRAGGQRTAH